MDELSLITLAAAKSYTDEHGGGGGGTTNYNNLENLPQINNNTLTGNKSASDLGLASEDDLADKQDALTAGNYISIANDGTISVTQGIGVYDLYSYKIEGRNGGGNYWTNVIKSVNGVQVSSDTYGNTQAATAINIDDMFTLRYGLGTDSAWHFKLLVDSNEHQAGEEITWKYNETKDFTETFNVSQDESTDLATKGDIDAAVSRCYHHAGTKTCAELVAGLLVAGNEGNVYNMTDSGTTTADFMEGAGQPIKAGDNVGIAKISDGVYKFDLLSGFVDTTNFVQKSQTAGLLKNDGTVNDEIEGDISSLKSGFTNLDNEVNGDATTYPYADVITIPDAVPSNLADCSVKIEPVQDLHGYDKPWVGGAGKNKAPLDLDTIKSLNTTGTWNGNEYTKNGGKVTVLIDSDNNVTGFNIGDTFSASLQFVLFNGTFPAGSYKITGGISDGLAFGLRNNSGTTVWSNGVEKSYELSEDKENCDMRIIIAADTFNNVKVYPMIRLATENDATFAPYTNLCPISGHTEVDVQRDGVNLLNLNSSNTTILKRSGSVSIINANSLSLSAMTNAANVVNVVVPCFRNTDYVVRFTGTNINAYGIKFYDEIPADWQNLFNGKISGNSENNKYILLCFRASDSMAMTVSDIQLEFGQVSSEFEPYQGKTYTIALGDTIYGGTVDFDSGVMTVTKALVDMGDFTWSTPSAKGAVSSTTPISGAINPQSNYDKANMDCSNYWVLPYYVDGVSGHDANSTDGAFGIWVTDNNKMFVKDSNLAGLTAEQVKTALTGSTVLFNLATPTIIQLTPQQIQLLKGQNTLTASTGQISVTANGVSGSIGAVQEQVNGLAEDVAEIKPLNYSTTEQKTGQKWIDGKDIYFKVFTDLSATIVYNSWVNIVEYPDVDSLIDYKAYSYAKHIISGVGIEVRHDSTSGYFQVQGEVNIANSRTITILVAFYTKTT